MNVVILNDTSPDMHHGCTRVMRLLLDGLGRNGMTVTATSPVRHNWKNDVAFRESLDQAALIVINGEGTLHHGKESAARLLSVTEVSSGTPVALVNCLYQDNPADWAKWLGEITYISARDSRSAREIGKCIGRMPALVPDLTLSISVPPEPKIGSVLYGDSVDSKISEKLAKLANENGGPLIPSISVLKRMKGRTALSRALRGWWIERDLRRMKAEFPALQLCKTEDEYAKHVARANLHVTGRFHGACYSMAARTPFIALESNSWKVEALISDAGLAPWRATDIDGLAGILSRPTKELDYSDQEREALDAYLDSAAIGAEKMFSDLGELARRNN